MGNIININDNKSIDRKEIYISGLNEILQSQGIVDGIKRNVYLAGEFHGMEGCDEKKYPNSIYYNELYDNILKNNSSNDNYKFIDFFIESNQVCNIDNPTQRLLILGKNYLNCFGKDKRKCPYNNTRIHWNDTRLSECKSNNYKYKPETLMKDYMMTIIYPKKHNHQLLLSRVFKNTGELVDIFEDILNIIEYYNKIIKGEITESEIKDGDIHLLFENLWDKYVDSHPIFKKINMKHMDNNEEKNEIKYNDNGYSYNVYKKIKAFYKSNFTKKFFDVIKSAINRLILKGIFSDVLDKNEFKEYFLQHLEATLLPVNYDKLYNTLDIGWYILANLVWMNAMDVYTIMRLFKKFKPDTREYGHKNSANFPEDAVNIIVHAGKTHTRQYKDILHKAFGFKISIFSFPAERNINYCSRIHPMRINDDGTIKDLFLDYKDYKNIYIDKNTNVSSNIENVKGGIELFNMLYIAKIIVLVICIIMQ